MMKAFLTAVARQGQRRVVSSFSTKSLIGRSCWKNLRPCISSSSLYNNNNYYYTTTTTTTKLAGGASTNSTLPRTNICILGAVNAGKSVLMNVLTQSEVSIVHDTAGTTTDPKICSMELHGTIGPVRLFDTPGISETGELGTLKRQKALHTVGQADVALIVADPFCSASADSVATLLRSVYERQEKNLQVQESTPTTTNTKNNDDDHRGLIPQPLVIYNLRADKVQAQEAQGETSVSMLIDDFEQKVLAQLPKNTVFPPTLAVDLQQVNSQRDRVISFLEQHASARPNNLSLLPQYIVDTHENGYSPTVFLNIPMDQQTPSMRLLRPQAMVQEALIRHFVSTYCYRMDLGLARSDNPAQVQTEKDRFLRVMDPLLTSGDLQLLITDSQAMDVVAPWTLDSQGQEIVPITTFSITMIRYLSGGRLDFFADGLRHLDAMMQGRVAPINHNKWRVLISEACNHTRLNMEKQCADIGTVQLPQHLQAVLGQVDFDYAFGKHVIFDPTQYDLVVHCGGCMVRLSRSSRQRFQRTH